MGGLPRLTGKEGWAERDRPGGGKPGPTAPGHRGSGPAPNGSSRSPPLRHGSGSASDWALAGGGPTECTTSRSGQLRVPSPTSLRPACPSERNGNCEAHRVDCVRVVSARHYVYLWADGVYLRSEEHTSELQSRQYIVCRLLLEKNTVPTSRLPPPRPAPTRPGPCRCGPRPPPPHLGDTLPLRSHAYLVAARPPTLPLQHRHTTR